jgi:hypothetical protein
MMGILNNMKNSPVREFKLQQNWQGIARYLANLLNTKTIESLDEVEKMGFNKCLKLIDETFNVNLSQFSGDRELERALSEWIDKGRKYQSGNNNKLIQSDHLEKCKSNEGKASSKTLYHRTTSTLDTKPNPSIASYSELKEVSTDSLSIGVNPGVYIEGTLCLDPTWMIGIMSVLEDKTGSCTAISFYNYIPDLNAKRIYWRLKQGTKIRIKEPYYKYTMGGMVTIRSDFATDIEFCDDFTLGDATKFKERGNSLYENEFFYDATLVYTSGIELSPPPSLLSILLCNRSICYMNLRNFTAAVRDCRVIINELAKVGASPDIVSKAKFRLGKSLVALGQFEEGLELLIPWPEERKISFQHFLQSTKGEYNWPSLAKQILKNGDNTINEIANYCHKDLRISFIENKGRGIIALKDFSAGSLLVVSKAVSVSFGKEQSGMDFSRMNIFNDMSHSWTRSQAIRLLCSNPSLLPNIYSLYDGTSESCQQLPRIENCLPVIDIKDEVIDLERIKRITEFNCFGLGGIFEIMNGNFGSDLGTAFHLLPSFFNHALYPNCLYLNAGDIMIIRANKFIKKGEELTVTYTGITEEERKKSLRMYSEEMIEGEERERREFDSNNELNMKLKYLREMCDDGRKEINLCENILSLGQLHPHYDLSIYYHRLCAQYDKKRDYKNRDKWMNVALKATQQHCKINFQSIMLNYRMNNTKEAEKISDLMFGPKTWNLVRKALDDNTHNKSNQLMV